MTGATKVKKARDENCIAFIEGDSDTFGYVAFALYVCTSAPDEIKSNINQKIAGFSQSDIDVFRSSAAQMIESYKEREIKRQADLAATEARDTAFRQLLAGEVTRLSNHIDTHATSLSAEMARSGGILRQILISVIASFVFGLVIVAAQMIDNPFVSAAADATAGAGQERANDGKEERLQAEALGADRSASRNRAADQDKEVVDTSE